MADPTPVFYGVLKCNFSTVGEHILRHLAPQEIQKYRSFRFPLRKASWLQGRLAAKLLVAKLIGSGAQFDLNRILIDNEASGAPFFSIVSAENEVSGCLTISHSGDAAFAALIWNEPGGVGADVEKIEPRTPEFIESYFTVREKKLLCESTQDEWPLYSNLIWSAKEALLKVQRIGLRVDTRSVEITGWEAGEFTGWHFLQARVFDRDWRVFWQRREDYVFTLVVDDIQEPRLIEIPLVL